MTNRSLLIAYTIFILLVFVLAYLRIIPTSMDKIPQFDLIGHFFLYGMWGFLSGLVYHKPVLTVGAFTIQKGIAIVTIIAVFEECLQKLSPVRTFSLLDMGIGISGILISCISLNIIRKSARRI